MWSGFVKGSINRQEATAQQVCDDTCLLCGLVLNYEYPGQSRLTKYTQLSNSDSACMNGMGTFEFRPISANFKEGIKFEPIYVSDTAALWKDSTT